MYRFTVAWTRVDLACKCVHERVCAFICVRERVCAFICVHECMCVREHVSVFASICVYKHV